MMLLSRQLTIPFKVDGFVIEMQILFADLSTLLIKHLREAVNCKSSVATFKGIMPTFVGPLNTRKQSFAGPIFSLYSFVFAFTHLMRAISPSLTASNDIGESEANSISIFRTDCERLDVYKYCRP